MPAIGEARAKHICVDAAVCWQSSAAGRARKRQPGVVEARKIRHHSKISVEVIGDGGASAVKVSYAIV